MTDKALPMQVKLAAVLAETSAGGRVNVRALCRELGISPKHFYELRRRFEAGGVEAVITPRSRRPRHSPGRLSAEVEDRIVRWRKELVDDGWDAGARSIRFRLERAGDLDPVPSVSAIHRVLRDHGLVVAAPNKKPAAADRRFVYPDPNACWQVDGTEWTLASGRTVTIIKVIDDHSRAVLGLRAAPGETLTATWACLATAMDTHGVPVRVLTDRGSALNGDPRRRSQFRERVRRRGALPISSRGYHPQTCGKTERSHLTLQAWLTQQPAARTIAELQTLLDRFVELFNTTRPHQALDGDTPTERYQGRPKVTPSGIPIDTNPIITEVTVSARGEVRTGPYSIQVGRRWTGARVRIIREDLNITILTDHELLTRLVINPDHRYQGNGRPYPRSPKPHPRKVLPMS